MYPTDSKIRGIDNLPVENETSEAIHNLPGDVVQLIFSSMCDDERVVQKGKMVSREYACLLTTSDPNFWKPRVCKGTVHTFEDIAIMSRVVTDLEKLTLKDVREPVKSWKCVAQLTHLTSLELECWLDYSPPGKEWRKNHQYDYLKRIDGSIPHFLQGPLKAQETRETVRSLANLTNLRQLWISPGNLFEENISSFTHLTKLERLFVSVIWEKNVNRFDSFHNDLIKLSNLRELAIGWYPGWVNDLSLFPILNRFGKLQKLHIAFNQENSQFRGLGQLRNLQELSMEISSSTQSIFNEIGHLTKLTRLHLHCSYSRFEKITAASIYHSVKQLIELTQFYIKAIFDKEEILATHLFLSLPKLREFRVMGDLYRPNLLEPCGYFLSKVYDNGPDFWD